MTTLHNFRFARPVLLLCVMFAVGYGFGDMPTPPGPKRVDRSIPSPQASAKQELAIVYIGSSTCGPSNNPRLPELLERAFSGLAEHAKQLNIGFATIGIARDRDPARGVAHLNKVGKFNASVTGFGWLNPGLTQYVYRDLPGPAITPQIVITLRDIDPAAVGRTVLEEKVLLRKVGVREIFEWVESGAGVGATP